LYQYLNISQNKKFKDDIELRNKKYGEIIHSIRKELEIAREQQKKGMLIMNPDRRNVSDVLKP